jgi:predicted transcriptional regulator
MQRTTIMAPGELLARLRRLAADRKVSMASVIREAFEEKAKTYRPKPRSLGMGDSGHTDTARRAADERRSWR